MIKFRAKYLRGRWVAVDWQLTGMVLGWNIEQDIRNIYDQK